MRTATPLTTMNNYSGGSKCNHNNSLAITVTGLSAIAMGLMALALAPARSPVMGLVVVPALALDFAPALDPEPP